MQAIIKGFNEISTPQCCLVSKENSPSDSDSRNAAALLGPGPGLHLTTGTIALWLVNTKESPIDIKENKENRTCIKHISDNF